MSSRRPVDPIDSAIEQHIQAVAALMGRSRKSGNDDVIMRLDLILAKLTSPTEYPVTWVKLEKYVELTGDSMDSVQSRRRVGKWLDGVQCKIVSGRLWINLTAAQRWVDEWDSRSSMQPLLAPDRATSKAKK